MRSPTIVWMASLTFLAYIGQYTFVFWFPTMLKRLTGFTDMRVGILGALPFVAGFVAMQFNGWHSDKQAERRWHSAIHYGMAAFFSMVEPAGGPPFARIDNGCLCNQPSVTGPCTANPIPQCYETDVQAFVDTTYNAPLCTQAAGGDTSNASLFLHDSILSGSDAQLSFPNTDVHQLFGEGDLTAAVPEAYQWSQAITSKRKTECVIGAGHSMPNFASAATKIVADLVAGCHLQ
jgi:hypothetical protein